MLTSFLTSKKHIFTIQEVSVRRYLLIVIGVINYYHAQLLDTLNYATAKQDFNYD